VIVRTRCIYASICIGLVAMEVCQAYITSNLPFEELTLAPVLATCVVEEVTRGAPLQSGRAPLAAHATLRVLRSFPPTTFGGGERIRLDYEALPAATANSVRSMSGPDVPPLTPDSVVVLALKLNARPTTDAWRLIVDEGMGLVVPAISSEPPFPGSPANKRDYLLREIASVLAAGTRSEALAEASYTSAQKEIAPDLMHLLGSQLPADDDHWALIAASLLSSMGVPRPTVAEFLARQDGSSLIAAVLHQVYGSESAKERLIHQLLTNSDIASWGTGVTLREFAQEPVLVRELREMLGARRPGSLYVARDVMLAGQKEILPDATNLAVQYISTQAVDIAEMSIACSVVRDFGSDQQFSQLLDTIKKYQYRDRRLYDSLWSATIWSDNPRERKVLEILSEDQRAGANGLRYSDIARGELTRINGLAPAPVKR
jgi:hypothetical protein